MYIFRCKVCVEVTIPSCRTTSTHSCCSQGCFRCHRYLLGWGCRLGRMDRMWPTDAARCRKRRTGAAAVHRKQLLGNLVLFRQNCENQWSFLIVLLRTWHFLEKKQPTPRALTLKAVFGSSFEVDQPMKAQWWGLNSLSTPGNEIGHNH